jgi:hypothetical protein
VRTVPVERRLRNRGSGLCIGLLQMHRGLYERRSVLGERSPMQHGQLDVCAVRGQQRLRRNLDAGVRFAGALRRVRGQ